MNQDKTFYARMTGAYGSVVIGAGKTITGAFHRLVCVTETVFEVLTNTLDCTAAHDVAASATLTFTDAPGVDGDEIEVNESTYLFKVEADPDELEISIGTGETPEAIAIATAQNVAAKLSGDTDLIIAVEEGVVTVTAATAGVGGNSIVLTATADNTTASGSGTLEGGVSQVRATAITYPAGSVLEGMFTTVKPTSGSVIGYNANRQ